MYAAGVRAARACHAVTECDAQRPAWRWGCRCFRPNACMALNGAPAGAGRLLKPCLSWSQPCCASVSISRRPCCQALWHFAANTNMGLPEARPHGSQRFLNVTHSRKQRSPMHNAGVGSNDTLAPHCCRITYRSTGTWRQSRRQRGAGTPPAGRGRLAVISSPSSGCRGPYCAACGRSG